MCLDCSLYIYKFMTALVKKKNFIFHYCIAPVIVCLSEWLTSLRSIPSYTVTLYPIFAAVNEWLDYDRGPCILSASAATETRLYLQRAGDVRIATIKVKSNYLSTCRKDDQERSWLRAKRFAPVMVNSRLWEAYQVNS
ncbi:unnamed protein product [Thlaspi arvense]|uniref:Uncharacterized protein n=1 Tax=Thlaspi arvense TaxID=13288 RepID=A0AAU9RIM4_THLAR|nr:unnamed protein product [Thlaspi arvense]